MRRPVGISPDQGQLDGIVDLLAAYVADEVPLPHSGLGEENCQGSQKKARTAEMPSILSAIGTGVLAFFWEP
jgi:hypothetical protein